jgi:caffeoyl-CoA O-methyltransferase
VYKRLKELRAMDYSELIRNIPRSKWNIKNKILLWQIKPKTAQKLYRLTKLKQPKLILELGTSAGFSTLILKKAAPKAEIQTIECVPYRIKLAKESFKGLNIILHEDKIINVLNKWEKKIDFLFLDADKENYLNYVKILIPFLTKNALIVADNVLDNPKKTAEFVKFMKNNFETRVYKLENGVLVSKPKSL